MTTQQLLAQALEEYERADPATQQEYIQHVRDMLERHEKSVRIIDTGYAQEYVEAGKLFLEQVNKHA